MKIFSDKTTDQLTNIYNQTQPCVHSECLSEANKNFILDVLFKIDLSTPPMRAHLIEELKGNHQLTHLFHLVITQSSKEPHLLEFDASLTTARLEQFERALAAENLAEQDRDVKAWLIENLSYFDKKTLERLSPTTLFRLANNLRKVPDQNDQSYSKFYGGLTEQYTQYIELLTKAEQAAGSAIKTIWEGVCKKYSENQEERYIAFASYINSSKYSITACMAFLSDQELMQLMPSLRYGNFQEVDTSNLYNLLERATQLEYLDCSDCAHLTTLPALPLCRTLDCSECTQLTTLPDLPLCQYLDCNDCTRLTMLPALPLCQHLDCSSCTQLTTLPDLPLCQHLDCNDCTRLTMLPALPSCQNLFCNDCTRLTTLPAALPQCDTLHCENCPNIQHFPQVPPSAQVYSGEGTPFVTLHVDVEKLRDDPRQVVLALGRNHLLIKKPFPNILLYEGGQQSVAIDVGGVRRHFITKLLESLFDQTKSENNRFTLNQDKFPCTLNIHDKDEVDCFKTLGCILALCHNPITSLKPGPLFTPEFYKKITLLPWLEEQLAAGNIQESAYLFLTYLEKPLAHQFLIGKGNVENTSKIFLDQVSSVLQAYGTQEESFYFNNLEDRKEILADVSQVAKENRPFQTLLLITEGMQQSFTSNTWQALQQAGHSALQDRVEGVLTAEILKKSLISAREDNVPEAQCITTMNYLTSWIEKADLKVLQDFVFAVTGNRALGNEKIKIQLVSKQPASLPVAHTCFFTLDLPSQYPSQEKFDEKILTFLEHACKGGGFQIA